MDNWKPQFNFIAVFLLLTSCSTFQVTERQPSSRADSFSAEEKSRFYKSLMPKDQQVENTIEHSDYGSLQKSCLQTDYGTWARHMKNSEELDQRYLFLIKKLNRPFHFLYVPQNDSKILILGRLDDFREMICVSLVLNGGNTGDEAPSAISSEFLKKTLQLENINSQVVDIVFNLWNKSDRDAKIGQMIVNHPLFNQFNLYDLIVSLFKKPMLTADRMAILSTILQSSIYESLVSEFSPLILRESSNFISAEERFLMFQMLIERKNNFDHMELLKFATSQTDPSKDYTKMYYQLSEGRSLEEQFEILSRMLYARANLPKAEEIFLDIWKQSKTNNLRNSIIAFAQNDLSDEKWLSREIIHRITFERLSSPYSTKGIKNTLSLYDRTEKASPEVKLSLMKLLANQKDIFDATCTQNFIDVAYKLRLANPAIDSELVESIIFLGTRFKSENEVFDSYIRYLKKMDNKKSVIALVQNLLPDIRIEESALILFARDAHAIESEDSYIFIEKVLSQPQITTSGLSELIGIVAPTKTTGFTPILSVGSKRALSRIVSHPKATDQVKEKANRYLNPVMKFIEDPSPRKN